MKHAILTTAFFFSIIFSVTGQNQADSIEVRKGFSTSFRQNGKVLSVKQLLDITKSNTEAYREMKIARNYNIASSIFGYIGGFLIGMPIGTAIAGGEPNWALAGAGAGFVVVGIPFSVAAVKHAKIAARIYNAGHKSLQLEFTSDTVPDPSKVQLPIDILSVLYFTPTDSTYQNYRSRLEISLKQDPKIISYEFREYTHGNGKIKSRGFKAKHKYGANEEYSYKIGTWEFYTKDGALESTVKYNLKEEVVK